MIDAHESRDNGNHRRHYRADVTGCAIVHARGGALRCKVGNVGLGGVLLRQAGGGAMMLEAGDEVTVEIEVAGAGWVVQRGRVLRHAGLELAIRFDLLSPDVEDLIEDEVLGAVEAQQAPRVVVVDQSADRRSRIAEELRRVGCCSLEASTPLEAVALVERSRNHVSAVALAQTQTQTLAEELVTYLAEAHPAVKVALIADCRTLHARNGGAPQVAAFLPGDGLEDLTGWVRELSAALRR